MQKSKDIIMISETDSEYIDKIILILNDDKKRIAPEELLLSHAEKIICEYEKKHNSKTNNSVFKIVMFSTLCFLISVATCFLGMHLFY